MEKLIGFLRRYGWLIVFLLAFVLALILFVFPVRAQIQIPKEPGFFLLVDEQTLIFINEQGKKQELTLSELDKEYFLQDLTRPSHLKKIGEYLIIAGTGVGTAGEIVGLAYPPLLPFIKIFTRGFGLLLGISGGLIRANADELRPELVPIRIQFLYEDYNYSWWPLLDVPTLFILTQEKLQRNELIYDGYLLLYGEKNPGGLRYSLVEIEQDQKACLKIEKGKIFVNDKPQKYRFVLVRRKDK